MPEICTCHHAREHHKKHSWPLRWFLRATSKCRPPKSAGSRKCSCEQYVEDEDQLTQSEKFEKSMKVNRELIRKTDELSAETGKILDDLKAKMDEAAKEIQQKLNSTKK